MQEIQPIQQKNFETTVRLKKTDSVMVGDRILPPGHYKDIRLLCDEDGDFMVASLDRSNGLTEICTNRQQLLVPYRYIPSIDDQTSDHFPEPSNSFLLSKTHPLSTYTPQKTDFCDLSAFTDLTPPKNHPLNELCDDTDIYRNGKCFYIIKSINELKDEGTISFTLSVGGVQFIYTVEELPSIITRLNDSKVFIIYQNRQGKPAVAKFCSKDITDYFFEKIL